MEQCSLVRFSVAYQGGDVVLGEESIAEDLRSLERQLADRCRTQRDLLQVRGKEGRHSDSGRVKSSGASAKCDAQILVVGSGVCV